MSPELNETIGLIVAGLSLFVTVVMIICLWVMVKRNKLLKLTINEKNKRIKDYIEGTSKDWKAISKLSKQVNEYRFVMAISDEITEDMQREIESLTLERDTLKAKLNHKKRPANGNS